MTSAGTKQLRAQSRAGLADERVSGPCQVRAAAIRKHAISICHQREEIKFVRPPIADTLNQLSSHELPQDVLTS